MGTLRGSRRRRLTTLRVRFAAIAVRFRTIRSGAGFTAKAWQVAGVIGNPFWTWPGRQATANRFRFASQPLNLFLNLAEPLLEPFSQSLPRLLAHLSGEIWQTGGLQVFGGVEDVPFQFLRPRRQRPLEVPRRRHRAEKSRSSGNGSFGRFRERLAPLAAPRFGLAQEFPLSGHQFAQLPQGLFLTGTQTFLDVGGALRREPLSAA